MRCATRATRSTSRSRCSRCGVDAFFSFDVYQDEKNSDTMAVHLSQGGLGLPERDFYFNPENGVANIREEYVAHIARTLVAARPRRRSMRKPMPRNVMAFETALAKASRKLEDLRDPQKNYNKMTPARADREVHAVDRLERAARGVESASGLRRRRPAGVLRRAR